MNNYLKDYGVIEMFLDRFYKGKQYTIGRLYINGKYFCDTLEDIDRGLTQDMPLEDIKRIKKPGITAIPAGTYKITLDVISPKFSKYNQYKYIDGKLPRLIDVPGFSGILIHIGNYHTSTDGCILVGKNTVKGAVMNSTDTFKALYDILKENKDNITITIK